MSFWPTETVRMREHSFQSVLSLAQVVLGITPERLLKAEHRSHQQKWCAIPALQSLEILHQ
jgi:hypothetical protein